MLSYLQNESEGICGRHTVHFASLCPHILQCRGSWIKTVPSVLCPYSIPWYHPPRWWQAVYFPVLLKFRASLKQLSVLPWGVFYFGALRQVFCILVAGIAGGGGGGSNLRGFNVRHELHLQQWFSRVFAGRGTLRQNGKIVGSFIWTWGSQAGDCHMASQLDSLPCESLVWCSGSCHSGVLGWEDSHGCPSTYA